MTSKSSLCDAGLLREGLRRNLWAFALALLVLFCALPLPITMAIQHGAAQIAQGASAVKIHAETLKLLQHLIGIDNVLAKLAMSALAVICGISTFSYLHSRQQIDFYHSLPVRRGTLLGTNYLTGVLLVLPLYLLMSTVAAAITSVGGYGETLGAIGAGIATDMVFFLLLYTLTVLCTILCGNRIVTLLLLGWAAFSGAIALGLFCGLFSFFYRSFGQPSSLTCLLISRLSPAVQYFSVTKDLAKQGYSMFTDTSYGPSSTTLTALLLGNLIATVLLLALSYVLFVRRKSERAGSALAFHGLKLPLKLWCVTVMSIGIGVLLHSICDTTGFTWLYFGFAFGGILTHFLMEIIYAFDFRAIFSHLKTFAVYAIVFIVVIVGMKLDPLGYDRYLPAETALQGVRFSAYGSYIYSTDNWEDRSLTDPDNVRAVLQLASYGMQHNLAAQDPDSTGQSTVNLNVTYLKKNGIQVSRHYRFPYQSASTANDLLQQVAISKEYIVKCMPAFTYELTGHELLSVHTEKSVDTAAASTSDVAAIGKIMSTLRRETLALTPEQAKAQSPVLCIDLRTYDPTQGIPKNTSSADYATVASSDYIPVYPNFTDTLALLQQMTGVVPAKLTAADVRSITLTLYSKKGTDDLLNLSKSDAAKTSGDHSETVSDLADIALLLKNVNVLSSYGTVFYKSQPASSVTVGGADYPFDVSVTLGNGSSFSLTYPESSVPTAVFRKYFS